MIRKRVQKRVDPALGGYQPRLTIVVEGIDDVYRIARHLETGQVEFGRMGRAILRSMDDQAPGSVAYLTARMGPHVGYGYRGRKRRGRQLKLELGMPPERVQEYAETVR